MDGMVYRQDNDGSGAYVWGSHIGVLAISSMIAAASGTKQNGLVLCFMRSSPASNYNITMVSS